ncbi:MAG TPA: hypothetical protein VMT46_02280 [Anaerolineaceae bacterium]|nr:hypothetical protein [Anaerolineaceae bacterium]
MRNRNPLYAGVVVILAIISLIQAYHSLNDYARFLRMPLWRMRNMTSFERSAQIFLGDRAAAFMSFLDSNIPENGTVTDVPHEGGFSRQNVLQFYLGPDRKIVSCGEGTPQANSCIAQPNTFVPSINDFPPASTVKDKLLVPYPPNENGYQGLYVPNGYHPAQNAEPQVTQFHPILTLLMDLAVIAAIWILGFLITWLFYARLNLQDTLIFAFPLGLGFLTWVLFITSWIGIPFTFPSVLIAYLCLTILLIAVHAIRGWTSIPPFRVNLDSIRGRFRNLGGFALFGIAGLVALGISAAILSVGRGYSLYDDLAIWSLKGYVIADGQTIFAAGQASGHGLAYPLNLSIAAAIFRLLDGDSLPGSKLAYIVVIGTLFWACFRFWKKFSVSNDAAIMGLFALISVPVIYQHATFGYANLPFTAYLVPGVLWSTVGLLNADPRSLRLGGLMLAFAGWTRPEGIVFAIALMVGLILVHWARKQKIQGMAGWIACLAIPGIWLIFSHSYVSQDQAGNSFRAMQSAFWVGDLGLRSLAAMFDFGRQSFLDVNNWGVLLVTMLLFIAITVPRMYQVPQKAPVYLLVIAVISFLFPVFLFYIAAFRESDFDTFLLYGFDRAFFPAIFFLALLAVLCADFATRASNRPDANS